MHNRFEWQRRCSARLREITPQFDEMAADVLAATLHCTSKPFEHPVAAAEMWLRDIGLTPDKGKSAGRTNTSPELPAPSTPTQTQSAILRKYGGPPPDFANLLSTAGEARRSSDELLPTGMSARPARRLAAALYRSTLITGAQAWLRSRPER